MKYKILNFKELGNNLSATYHLNKDDGKNPYVKGTNGLLIAIGPKKSIPKSAIYLTVDKFKEYNKLTEEINKLKEKKAKILD